MSVGLILQVFLFALQSGASDRVDLTQCVNCDVFPEEWLTVETEHVIDLESLAPERRLDFLIGEWEVIFPNEDPERGIHYTAEMPVGFDLFGWFIENRVIEGFQEWPFTNGGSIPFRAKTDFRYIAEEGRWQLVWLAGRSFGVYTGGLEAEGVMAFYEHEPTGGSRQLTFRPGGRYVFRGVTRDRFIVEWYDSDDGGETFRLLKWRGLYRRRR